MLRKKKDKLEFDRKKGFSQILLQDKNEYKKETISDKEIYNALTDEYRS